MPTPEETLQLLEHGEMSSLELSPVGSNYTFLASIKNGAHRCKAIYKPRDGEIPLWDFPGGTLYRREYQAYLLSQVLGWDFIPTTIVRDGPYGIGSVQLYVEHDPRVNYFVLKDSNPQALKTIACFDLIGNNTDRKASHCIQDAVGKVWGIDHGLTFHQVLKVRTVIWDFGGEPIPDPLLDDLAVFQKNLENPTGALAELVDLSEREETEALAQRVAWVLEVREYPAMRPRPRLWRP